MSLPAGQANMLLDENTLRGSIAVARIILPGIHDTRCGGKSPWAVATPSLVEIGGQHIWICGYSAQKIVAIAVQGAGCVLK